MINDGNKSENLGVMIRMGIFLIGYIVRIEDNQPMTTLDINYFIRFLIQ